MQGIIGFFFKIWFGSDHFRASPKSRRNLPLYLFFAKGSKSNKWTSLVLFVCPLKVTTVKVVDSQRAFDSDIFLSSRVKTDNSGHPFAVYCNKNKFSWQKKKKTRKSMDKHENVLILFKLWQRFQQPIPAHSLAADN